MRHLLFPLAAAVAPLAVATPPQVMPGLRGDSKAAIQPSQKDGQDVVGEWTLCSERIIRTKKGRRRSLVDTVTVMTNVCTDIVFKADGKGLAGLSGGTKYEFLWQQQGQAITITYLPTSVDPTRLQAGTYQFALSTIPAHLSNPSFTQLALSTGNRTLFLLRVKQSK